MPDSIAKRPGVSNSSNTANSGQTKFFEYLRTPRDLLNYTLMRGTTDWSQLEQFNLYEKGYPLLVVVSVPDFLKKLAVNDTNFASLLKNYVHILEYEFMGMDGLDNLTAEQLQISNNFTTMQVIGKTQAQSATTFTFTYQEKAGSVMTKVNEVYLRCVRDPNTGYKHYGNLIVSEDDYQAGNKDGTVYGPSTTGFENETFSFLYMHTDSTGLALERSVFLVGAQPMSAPLNIYNATKGSIEFTEVQMEFSAYPIYGSEVDKRANEILKWIMSENNRYQLVRNSYDYKWSRTTALPNNHDKIDEARYKGAVDGIQMSHLAPASNASDDDKNASGNGDWIVK